MSSTYNDPNFVKGKKRDICEGIGEYGRCGWTSVWGVDIPIRTVFNFVSTEDNTFATKLFIINMAGILCRFSCYHTDHLYYIMKMLHILFERGNINEKKLHEEFEKAIDLNLKDFFTFDAKEMYNRIVKFLDIVVKNGLEQDRNILCNQIQKEILGYSCENISLEDGVDNFFKQLEQKELETRSKVNSNMVKQENKSCAQPLSSDDDVTIVQPNQQKSNTSNIQLGENEELIICHHDQPSLKCPYTQAPLGDRYVTNKACSHKYSCKGVATFAQKKCKCPLFGCDKNIEPSELVWPSDVQLHHLMSKEEMSTKLWNLVSSSEDPTIKKTLEIIKWMIEKKLDILDKSIREITSKEKAWAFSNVESLRFFTSQLIGYMGYQLKDDYPEIFSDLQKALKN